MATPDNKVVLQIEAKVATDKMYLRLAGADADLPDGRHLQVSAGIDQCSIIVTLTSADKKILKTYHFGPQEIGQAVLAVEAAAKPPEEETSKT